MSNHMRNRGPDDEDVWIDQDGRVGFAHRRLSIIDLNERSRQPMFSSDAKTVITFNGEIYNYSKLTDELKQKGCCFKTESDTEVLLHLYERHGFNMVQYLRGMFAFAIWDERRQLLFLARDPYGIKPLYVSNESGVFRFASQAKALVSGGAISCEDDPAGWIGFYLFGSVPEPFTTWRSIQSLPAGTTLVIEKGVQPKQNRYHSIAEVYHTNEDDPAIDCKKSGSIREAVRNSVSKHLVSDVPVGCFLSAGIDSSCLLALMCELSDTTVRAVTVGFSEFENTKHDEVAIARAVANHYGADHHVRIVNREEFLLDLPKIVSAMDQPTIDGINTWFASKAAREEGLKVAISGLGGDELFGGYKSFNDIPRWISRLSFGSRIPGLGKAVRTAVTKLQTIAPIGNPKIGGIFEYGHDIQSLYFIYRGLFMPWELEQFFSRDFVQEGLERLDLRKLIASNLCPAPNSKFNCVAVLEASVYMRNQLLRDSDWASMAHSLEVRTPLVDSVLLQKLAPVISNPSKQFLADVPSKRLPDEVLSKSKTGFATPTSFWASENKRSVSEPLSAEGSRRWAMEVASRWNSA